ncbi:DHA1 family bicyclomycin/chloramphenicol resistance-like MFS transporter [Agromyces flavus]|uniref:DHA1 family bicyclomycin/chloramphenicol resistance-like MFS transporter n=1 Tax=Agromyces flavus TaxID=589382 RepID=A0A1H1VGK4_9MICO|nr:multidrug effflux MFS transporter [Agromyces flavus]MCP2365921.1 DHA1 family bicyclomycin/chloramphenicol resistance-like MFS transporter [Agromyces flavus]GGI43647.1 Bcr/CflA family drug resistance efflux transporter [Agromyces flavus]SDS83501.1 MFS transporter, DHA1 family, bicyclomycin/chloramphenicol resistance protein [Agromyces flavus]
MSTASIPIVRPDDYTAPRHPGDLLSRRQRLVYVLVLGALTALGPFTIDLYLPAFPALEAELGVNAAAIQITLTGTMIGFGLGQLIVGPWSDKVGRRLPLMLSTALHIAASVAAALAPDIAWLVVFRLLQGFGAAAGGVVAMAMVRDLFGGKPLVRMLSRLALVNGLAPVLAPVIGSQLLQVMDWRGVFWVLAGYGLVVVAAVGFFIVETLPESRRHIAGHSSVGQRYRALFRDRVYLGAALVGGMTFTGLFAYLSTSSFLFQQVYEFTPQQYGILFAVNSIGVVAGVQISSRLIRGPIPPQYVIAGTTVVHLAMAIAIVVLDGAGAGFWGTAIPLWIYIAACGFTFPAVQVLALANHGAEAGTAASLLGALNFGLAGAISPLAGLFGVGSAVPMAVVMLGAAVIAIAGVWALVRPATVPALSD